MPLPICPSLINKVVCSPLSFNNFSGSSIKSTTDDIGVTRFEVNEADLKKDLNSLARKYKLDNLFVAKLLIDSNILNVQSTNVTASNCYFKLDDTHKNKIKIPCEWKAVRGGRGYSRFLVNFEKENGQLKAVLHDNGVQTSSKEVFKLTVRQYRAKCSSKYIHFVYTLTSNSYNNNLYLFIGKPNMECNCKLRSRKFEILKNNKNVPAYQLYKIYNSEFVNSREIYNLRRKFGISKKKVKS